MTSRAKKPAVTEPPFISASLRDSRFIEEHARAFMEKLEAGKNIEAKSNFQSEINIGIAKFEDKPDQISINLKFTTSVVEAADESNKIAEYEGHLRHIYEVIKIYGEIDESKIPIAALQPYVYIALLEAVSRAREAFARLGMANVNIPVPADLMPAN